jgi:hypothetical protein
MRGRVWGYPKSARKEAIVLERKFERIHKDTPLLFVRPFRWLIFGLPEKPASIRSFFKSESSYIAKAKDLPKNMICELHLDGGDASFIFHRWTITNCIGSGQRSRLT